MEGVVALVPARGGSKRVPGKNIRLLGGFPLIAHTINAAAQSGEFDSVLVSSDDVETLAIAHQLGANTLRRPEAFSTDTSPDIDWVRHALGVIAPGNDSLTFAILRPTSPFRTAETITRAMQAWRTGVGDGYSSLRAIEPAAQHPAKMWRVHANEMVPLLPQPTPQPWHDSQYPMLPPVFVQNASLEITTARTVQETGTISGSRVLPFLTQSYEGFDINTGIDWMIAEALMAGGEACLPELRGVIPVDDASVQTASDSM